MASKSKSQLTSENVNNFPNNNSGFITPEKLRTFNGDMIDSTVNQEVYTTDSASFDTRINDLSGSLATDTGSLLVTASYASQNLTFTKGDGSQFSVFIPDESGSILPQGVVSGSSQIDYPLISNIPSGIVSSSSQVSYPQLSNIPSGIISSSEQLPSGLVSGSSQVSYTELSNIPSGIVSSSSQISDITGSSLVTASLSGNTITFTKGDTTTFGFTIPDVSGSDISQLNAFTQSQEVLNTTFATTGSNTFEGINIFNAEVTASELRSYGGLTVEGSSQLLGAGTYINAENIIIDGGKLIQLEDGTGWARIWQNPNYPTTYYGSALNWSSTNLGGISTLILSEKTKAYTEINAWSGAYDNKIRINVDSNGVQFNDWDLPSYGESTWLSIQQSGNPSFQRNVEVTGSIAITGQLTASLQEGYVWVGDSSGRTVTVSTGSFGGTLPSGLLSSSDTNFTDYSQSVDTRINNIVTGTGFATTGSNNFYGNQFISGGLIMSGTIDVPVIEIGQQDGNGINLYQNSFSQIRFWSGSNQTDVGTWVNMQTNPTTGGLSIAAFPHNYHFVHFEPFESRSRFEGQVKFDDSIIGNIQNDVNEAGNAVFFQNPDFFSSYHGTALQWRPDFNNGVSRLWIAEKAQAEVYVNAFSGAYDTIVKMGADSEGGFFSDWDLPSYGDAKWLKIPQGGNPSFQRTVEVTGSVDIQGQLTASLQEGYVWVGDVNGRTVTAATSSFGGGGGASFPYSGSVEITGSVKVKPYTLSVVSNTASIDMNESNYFILNLPTGSTTHVDFTNIIPGESINLLVSQSSGVTTGSIDFAPNIYFPAGNNMVATQTGSARDIVSFITFNENEIYATSVKNLY